MKTETAIDLCEAIKQYLCAGNPIWNTEKIQEALNMAIDALKTQLSTESTTFEWIPCSTCERRCNKWADLKTSQE